MTLKANVSILVGSDGATIEIRDGLSRIRFVKLTLTPEQLCRALSREVEIECEMQVTGLDKVGKKMEMANIEFEMPEENRNKELAARLAGEKCPDGWQPDLYFGSKDSFFNRNGKLWGRTIIRRWIDDSQTDGDK